MKKLGNKLGDKLKDAAQRVGAHDQREAGRDIQKQAKDKLAAIETMFSASQITDKDAKITDLRNTVATIDNKYGDLSGNPGAADTHLTSLRTLATEFNQAADKFKAELEQEKTNKEKLAAVEANIAKAEKLKTDNGAKWNALKEKKAESLKPDAIDARIKKLDEAFSNLATKSSELKAANNAEDITRLTTEFDAELQRFNDLIAADSKVCAAALTRVEQELAAKATQAQADELFDDAVFVKPQGPVV